MSSDRVRIPYALPRFSHPLSNLPKNLSSSQFGSLAIARTSRRSSFGVYVSLGNCKRSNSGAAAPLAAGQRPNLARQAPPPPPWSRSATYPTASRAASPTARRSRRDGARSAGSTRLTCRTVGKPALADESTRTLFCGDLFTQPGNGDVALTSSDILAPSEAFRHEMDHYAHSKNAAPLFAKQRFAHMRPSASRSAGVTPACNGSPQTDPPLRPAR